MAPKIRLLLRFLKNKTCVIKYLVLALIVSLCNIYALLTRITVSAIRENTPVNFKYVVVHLDFKGAPPKLSFLKTMVLEIKLLGANALLLEYEDMFPFEGQLVNLSKPGHYEKSELRNFLVEVNEAGLEVIPLIQTFGHMEFVLKQEEFEELRESQDQVNSICPSHSASLKLIDAMLQQVIEFHESVVPLKHLHIGCDEVWAINICERCKRRELNDYELFVDHVRTVSRLIHQRNPMTTVLIWDDMFRALKPSEWKQMTKSLKMIIQDDKIEPVYWDYNSNIKPHIEFYNYHKHFPNIWIASAYKGADGETAIFPDFDDRTTNILTWLYLIQDYVFAGEDKVYNFKGIILTGWSRYNHFKPICELLPVSYKSLISSLLVVNRFQNRSYFDNGFVSKKKLMNDIFGEYFNLVNDQPVLNSTDVLFAALKKYDKFLKVHLNFEATYAMCSNKIEMLHYVEKNVKKEMHRFFSLQDVDEYLFEKKMKVRESLRYCWKFGLWV